MAGDPPKYYWKKAQSLYSSDPRSLLINPLIIKSEQERDSPETCSEIRRASIRPTARTINCRHRTITRKISARISSPPPAARKDAQDLHRRTRSKKESTTEEFRSVEQRDRIASHRRFPRSRLWTRGRVLAFSRVSHQLKLPVRMWWDFVLVLWTQMHREHA